MSTQLYKISYPELTSPGFGENLKKAFENIDSNFQKLASLGLTTGEPGTPAIWVPYNLNSVFCYVSNGGDFVSDYLNDTHIAAIESSYTKYNAITESSRTKYIEECKSLYKSLIGGLPDDSKVVTSSNEQKQWKHKWELYDGDFIFDNLNPNDSDQKQYINQYLDFLPGDILVAGNWDEESKTFTKLSTTAHIYIDPRFRNPFTIAGDVDTESISTATDQSCVLYGGLNDDKKFIFKYVYAFPRIHCKDGEFYLSVNGIDTNIPLTGATGKAGKDSQFAAVQMVGDSDAINKIVYGTTTEVGRNFAIDKLIGTDSSLTETQKELLDGCPAFIFPPISYTANAYVTLYWVGYLKYENNTLIAYCGRENLIMVDLYEHSFGGMMMGLDMYEKSIARPAGNAPWTKPRGLMLPIGARYIGSNNQSYWNPIWEYDANGKPTGVPNINNFGAHLIYSKKDDTDLKTELHIGSIDDYRRIGLSDAGGNSYANEPLNHKVGGTKLFIDEPVIITKYGVTKKIDDTLDEDTLFINMGSSYICGDSTVKNHSNVGSLSVATSGTIGKNLIIGKVKDEEKENGTIKTFNGYLSVGGLDEEDDKNGGVINANKFKRRNAQKGQLLLANGDSTCEFDDQNTKSPIRIMNSSMGSQKVGFEFENKGDGSHYFLGDIADLIPESPEIPEPEDPFDNDNIKKLPTKSFNYNWAGAAVKYPDQYSIKGYVIAEKLVFLNIHIKYGGDYGSNISNNDENSGKFHGKFQIKNLTELFDNQYTKYVKPAYKQYHFMSSTNFNKTSDSIDDDAMYGIRYYLGTNGEFGIEEATCPHHLYGVSAYHEYDINLIYLIDTNSSLSSTSTTTSIGTTSVSPTTYLADEPNEPILSNEEPQIYKYYWVLDSKPEDGAEILSISNKGPVTSKSELDIDSSKYQYIISVSTTQVDTIDRLPSSGIKYNEAYSVDDITYWGPNDWTCETRIPTNITYRWHQTKEDFDASVDVNSEIKTYLTNTTLAYKDESTDEWAGKLIEMINKTEEQYTRYEGAHGVVSASHYKDSTDIWITEITIEAWSKDLKNVLNIAGHRLALDEDNQLEITSIIIN